jgi:hypothetical protein
VAVEPNRPKAESNVESDAFSLFEFGLVAVPEAIT